MRYRVDELAARCDLTVDTVRYYQARGLLDPPLREGRVAWYDEAHVERLARIDRLKERGLPLAAIQRLLSGDAADAALAEAVAGTGADEDQPTGLLTLGELAARTGVAEPVLEAIAREGFIRSRETPDGPRWAAADADVVASGLALLEAGLPLGELLDVARDFDKAMRGVAERAVETFLRFVRDPIQGSAASEQEASDRLVTAFRRMLPATTAVVGHHFRALLVEAALARIEEDGDAEEIAVARDESLRAEGAAPTLPG